VHERCLTTVHEQKLHFLLVEPHPLDSLLRAETFVEFRAATQIAQFDLSKGATLPRLHQFSLQHEPELVLVLENVARLDVDGIYFHWQDLRRATGWSQTLT